MAIASSAFACRRCASSRASFAPRPSPWPSRSCARRSRGEGPRFADLKHVPKHVNNWDLVDSSAHYIVGAHLVQRERSVLHELARSPHLWSRRVAIIATFWFIKQGFYEDTLAIAEQFAR